MRVVSGRFRGRTLYAPKGMNTRPTSDAARKALFDILENGLGVEFQHAADFFAGTGALGIEALSRGAETLVAFEKDREAQKSIERNLTTVGLEASNWQLVRDPRIENWGRTLAELQKKKPSHFPLDVVFCDPPYAKELVQSFFKSIEPLLDSKVIFAQGVIFCVEVGVKEKSPELNGFEIIRERAHGAAKLLLYRKVKS